MVIFRQNQALKPLISLSVQFRPIATKTPKTKLTPRGIGYLITKYADQANIENLRPHDLRHRFGYRMAEPVPLHRLAKLWGTIHWTQRCCMFEGHKMICNRLWKPLPGNELGPKSGSFLHVSRK
jgi:hypothetical protein